MTQFLLILLAVALFYWLSRSFSKNQHTYSKEQFTGFTLDKTHLAHSELGLFVALVAKVAKADGRVNELEAELISNMFNDISALFPNPKTAKTLLVEIFDHEKQIPYNLDIIALELQKVLKDDPLKRRRMMEFLVNLAYIDGVLSHIEESMLHKIAAFMQLHPGEFSSMMDQFGSLHRNSVRESSVHEAYEILGISPDATLDAVKKAYRSKVREYHPDIIKAQGASDEYLKEATEKVQEINAAYEMIKNRKEAIK